MNNRCELCTHPSVVVVAGIVAAHETRMALCFDCFESLGRLVEFSRVDGEETPRAWRQAPLPIEGFENG